MNVLFFLGTQGPSSAAVIHFSKAGRRLPFTGYSRIIGTADHRRSTAAVCRTQTKRLKHREPGVLWSQTPELVSSGHAP